MSVFDHPEFEDHEQVVFVHDRDAGLTAIIAVHDSTLGPAGGGVRFHPYTSSDDALTDVLRLSKAMTWKMALADLPFGGGKSVILGDPTRDKTAALFEAFGRAMDLLGGRYICGEDVGTTPEDMAVIHRRTRHVAGRPDTTGDTSPATGHGVFQAIRAAVARKLGRDSLAGVRVAVQGAGNVGRYLCRHLAEAGAEILVADVNPAAVAAVVSDFGARAVPAEGIVTAEADVLAPCALGGVINDDTIDEIRAEIVCGGANNQLAEARHGQALHDRGILFVPDYVSNCGGAISGTSYFLGRDGAEVTRRLDAIYDTCLRLFEIAEREGLTTDEAALRLARRKIAEKRGGTARAA
ncbi:MAG: Glu/Leu/Phe/Val dehydrogenase [Alphaproteobacteria bacterium]|nr:Glu/Leu/Phe/Val dehydrogenase [Alphaproteobacteria bacterium]